MSAVRIALVRSIVIARQRLTNTVLSGWGEAVGGTGCRTVAATGNLVFRSPKSPETLSGELETACAVHYGTATEIVVKTGEEWRALLAANPFAEQAATAPSRLLVWAMRQPLSDAGLEQLRRRAAQNEDIKRLTSGDFYVWFGQGPIRESKIPGGFSLRQLGAVGTSRNWNTARRIETLVAAAMP